MPAAARRKRERETGHATHHKVTGVREGWNANPDAVAMLCRVLGYPTSPPHTKTPPRPHFLPF